MNDEFNCEQENNEELHTEEPKETYVDDYDILEDELTGENFVSQKIYIPEVPEEPPVNNKGLKVFCAIIAFVVALSIAATAGYFVGKTSTITRNYYTDTDFALESKPTDEDTDTLEVIYNENAASIVGILVYNDEGNMGEASGVVYSKDGYIITNDHIYSSVAKAKFKVFTSDGKEYDASYVAGDTRSDLAVLKVTDDVELKPAVFGNSDEVVSGEKVCAIGCPNGYSSRSTITSGIVSVPKVRQSITTSYSCNFIQTDSPINPGNSGGALLNMYGQVIGVTSSKIASTSYEGVGYAIPTVSVQRVVESLIENGKVVDRAKLGISYRFYNSAMAEIQGLDAAGLLVAEVTVDSDLYGKLSVNDIITRVNDVEITDDSVILDIIEVSKPGDTLLLTVVKTDGSTVNLNAVLLADEGSTSYTNENPTVSDDNSSQYNDGIFNFPEGY